MNRAPGGTAAIGGFIMGLGRSWGVVVLATTVVTAGNPGEPQKAPPVFGVDVRVIAVPVFVTDKNGRAVGGLTAGDFAIEDSGRSVALAGFLAVDAGAPPTGLAIRSGGLRLLAASRRQFLLLFDLMFSSPGGILKARKAALEWLENAVQPGDLVGMAKVGPAGLEIVVGFTPDHIQVARAVFKLAGGETTPLLRDPLGLAYDLGVPPEDSLLAKWGQALGDGEVMQISRMERTEYHERVLAYVQELQRLAEILDSVQGRKQVILVSGGFDQSVLLGAEATERAASAMAVIEGRIQNVQSDRHFGDAQARTALKALYETLARTDTVLHTIDVAGLAAGAGANEFASVPQGSGRGTLSELAGRSGGRFVRQGNDLAGALREVLDASRYYYVLAFEPADAKAKPGELRKLKIEVERPGLTVSHRAGYTVPDSRAVPPPTARLQAAEVIAKGLSGGALRLRAIAVPYRNPHGQLSLPVVLEIDGESLLAGTGAKQLRLEVYGYALDGEGRIEDALGASPTLELDTLGPSIRRKGLQILTAFRVHEGPADLRFLVREPTTSRAGSLRITSLVPAFQTGASVLSPPLLMDDPRARVVIPTPSRMNQDLEIPFRLDDTPFVPEPAPVLRNGESREVCIMVFGSAQHMAATLKAALVRDDEQILPLEAGVPRLVEDADRFGRLVVTVTPKGIPAGDYRLRVSAAGLSASDVMVRVDRRE